ncbi:MAG: AAA family ATPase, partial [Lachnospiraceae bacterium]
QGELDFLVERGGEVLPIEIKSGKNYAKHAALSNVLDNENYALKEAYVFYNGNVKAVDKVVYYPVYMLMFVEKETEPEELIYRIDLEGLK